LIAGKDKLSCLKKQLSFVKDKLVSNAVDLSMPLLTIGLPYKGVTPEKSGQANDDAMKNNSL